MDLKSFVSSQIIKKYQIPIKIINLKKRIDRKKSIIKILNDQEIYNYEFIEAIDGNELIPTIDLKLLFLNNDFGNRKGVIGCALSHYNLWKQLENDINNDFYIIMEDDFTLCDNFKIKFESLINEYSKKDIIFLGYHMFSEYRDSFKNIYNNQNNNINIELLNKTLYIGGYFAYSINKNGVKILLDYINNNGIKHGIDYLNKIIPQLNSYECQPQLVFSKWNENGALIDSNIQYDFNGMDFRFINIVSIKSKIRVKMLCNWCSSEQLCIEWSNMTENLFNWKNIEVTWHNDNIDYYVIINYPQNNEYYDPKKTIIFQMEPKCNNDNQNWGVKTWGSWENPDVSKFLEVRTHEFYYNNCTSQLKINYSELSLMPIIKRNDNYISTICSSKYFDPGHIKRIDFLKFLEEKNDNFINIDIYGFENKHNFKNYKGSLENNKKENGLLPYKYYFMAENNIETNYISEKFWEPLLCECLCFYYGAPNVSNYINPKAFIQLNLENFEESYNIIKYSIENNLYEKRLSIIKEEKYKILNYYNFYPTIERIITKDLWNKKIQVINNTKIIILDNGNIYKLFPFINTLYEFGFNIEIYNYINENELKIENIELINNQNIYNNQDNQNIIEKRILYKTINNKLFNIKYIKTNNYLKVLNHINIYEKNRIYDKNYFIIESNDLIKYSYDLFFNYILLLPYNYDICMLNIGITNLTESITNKEKIIYDQNNCENIINNKFNYLYYTINNNIFNYNGPYFISNNGINKILNYTKNNIKYNFEELFYKIYNNIKDFNIYLGMIQ